MPYEIEIEKPMRTFIVNYSYPVRFRGTYCVTAKDSFEAGDKVRSYLENKWGHYKDQMSIVMEVYDNQIQMIG